MRRPRRASAICAAASPTRPPTWRKPTGLANTGEVEDYQVTILARDLGDAPDTGAGTGVGNYNTTAADNGPQHTIIANLRLGLVDPDADDGTLQNAAADADDTTNTGAPTTRTA